MQPAPPSPASAAELTGLPDLARYREELVAAGAPRELPFVPSIPTGLLAQLPPPPPGKTGWPWTVQSMAASSADNANLPTILVVMPSFRQAAYLEEGIRSVLLQNYPRLQFVLMDGGSDDASPRIIERYRPWLSFARCAPDHGQSHAVNLGHSLGTPQIRGWLNSDDLYLPGTLRSVADTWQRGADFIYGDELELDESTGRRSYHLAQFVHGRYVRFPGLVYQPSAFWSGRIHQPVWEKLHCAMDYELWVRLLPGRRIGYVPRALSLARKHSDAKTYSAKMQERWQADAVCNGQAHPELYRETWANRWLKLEYRLVQRLTRHLRSRTEARRFATIEQACGWKRRATPA